ncbi:LysR family transcriptional regulator [Kordiimonas pumila]|uniref:LysR family transcriptional regulator n=1 Tax=Kordiimonas pumila TaxID=2161677 RepID=A0ABV7D6T6_9PROT|nr:LysR family transcriptional regulator [Kordiimonas pumila]
MYSLDDLALFIAIAEHGGFTAAAKAVQLPKSTVSRRLSDYEARLGITLFQRSTRALSLTNEGMKLYQSAKPAIEAALAIDQTLSEKSGNRASGRVSITTTAAMGQHLVAPHLPALLDSYPNIQVELRLSENRINIINDAVDIAIRMGELEDSDLMARRLTSINRLVVATPTYLAAKGTPRTPQDLMQHNCIITRQDLSVWHFPGDHTIHIKWQIAAGNMLVARDLTLASTGISILPAMFIEDDLAANRLVPILADYPLESAPAWIVATRQKHRSLAVRTVMDHLITAFAHPAQNQAQT